MTGPGHAGIDGNEVADARAKEAAQLRHISARDEGRTIAQAAMDPVRESPTRVGRPEAYNTTVAFLKRRVTEAKWRDSTRWIKERVDKQRMRTYILSHRQKPDPTPANTRKGIARRFYQLKTGHALIGTYLHWRTLRADNTCWWCTENTPQNLHHLFKRCSKWQEQQKTLWRDIREATKDPPGRQLTERDPMPKVFNDWRCSKPILNFLAHTDVGRTCPQPAASENEDSEEEDDDDSWSDVPDEAEGPESDAEEDEGVAGASVGQSHPVRQGDTGGG